MASREQPLDTGEQIRRLCADAELQTVFQPMIELESNECIAYEALTRFPQLPARTTSEWFATATELGVGAELELAAISAAISHLREFPAGAVLAINVSPAVALTDEFFERVAPVADRLIIELTEHEPVENYEALADVLSHLRGLGARIAIDDVGAGFASLRHILRLAPDMLKLDPSLTHGVETDAGSRALTSALVDFARNTGALITAEGIETTGELDLLRELGVDHGQGYLLGRPGPFKPHLN